ncbi:hypothetical protein CMQ_1492 [Grosmannia clavigera kw1407]|uniref:Uncharacterized protein n=1 Tax=Grosmannia clavigera (strain kw1407 / UAMH 11150) TaxID=655863 RepID=F0XED5_GROCL|nr:uncharacterized protein CMQ_1492 [Grosmannia clavigera kw1407]EFX04564.1 hypothetical protein CMQ_1492 [Grosmannia clavigera kw1407]
MYVLARPRCMEDGDEGPLFVCDENQKRDQCGDIKTVLRSTVRVYEPDLNSPDSSELHDNEAPFTFEEPNAEDRGVTIEIPMLTINSDITVLYEQIWVPDIISWVEYGRCNGGREAAQNFISWRVPGDCGAYLFCPLCIGIEYAEESLWQNESHYGKYEDDEVMNNEDYNEWRIKRLRELGYHRYFALVPVISRPERLV